MLPGPVFNVELLTTSRRLRYYLLRMVYGACLLAMIWQSYESSIWRYDRRDRVMTIHEMSRFAQDTYFSFLMVQSVAVLLLTPAMLAGSIAEETQRKTLHYLLASRLTSPEIVLGKLCARLLHVYVFVAIGLPVMSLIGLFGGVDPRLVVASTAVTLTTAFFLAGLSILVSTITRRPREAIIVTYLLGLIWLFVPVLIEESLRWSRPAIHAWIKPVLDWVLPTGPLGMIFALGRGGGSWIEAITWTLGLQVACGLLFVTLAVIWLRPGFARSGADRGGWKLFGKRRRIRFRPECGDLPMIWKEVFVQRPGGLVRWVARLAAAVGLAFVSYWVAWLAGRSVVEAWGQGFGMSASRWGPRGEFNVFLRGVGGVVYSLWGLGVAVSAAGGVTSERESDTWTSLTTTDLTGAEILAAKMLGAIWSTRALALTLVILWLFGVAAGAVHPLGFVAAMVGLVVFTWFFAALGTTISMWARNTTRAMFLTVTIILVTNGGYLMCCIPTRPGTTLVTVGATPYVVGASLLSYWDLGELLNLRGTTSQEREWMYEGVLTVIASILGYGLAALALTAHSVDAFDESIDRPRRSPSSRSTKRELDPDE